MPEIDINKCNCLKINDYELDKIRQDISRASNTEKKLLKIGIIIFIILVIIIIFIYCVDWITDIQSYKFAFVEGAKLFLIMYILIFSSIITYKYNETNEDIMKNINKHLVKNNKNNIDNA